MGLHQAVCLEQLDPSCLPPLLDPRLVLSDFACQQLQPEQWGGWRCGRAFPPLQPHAPDTPVLVLGPDGNLAGMARAGSDGLLQPKLVFDAAS
jgi:tRNA pseudouridine55 synthase